MSDKKIESFLDTVYGAAEAKAKKMVREIDRAGEASLREYKAELRRSADADRRRERARAARLSAETAAHEESEIRHALLDRRREITDEVFSEIKRRIADYRTSADYGKSLLRDAETVREMFRAKDCVTVFISPEDEKYAKEIERASGFPVRTDPSIKLGGLRAESSDMECDCTLDSGFEHAREDFVRESGLSVV